MCVNERGLHAFLRWNMIFTNPPLSITEAQLHEGFDVIDRALDIADRAVV
jgi:taurine---2-oxoglutarate transaminase